MALADLWLLYQPIRVCCNRWYLHPRVLVLVSFLRDNPLYHHLSNHHQVHRSSPANPLVLRLSHWSHSRQGSNRNNHWVRNQRVSSLPCPASNLLRQGSSLSPQVFSLSPQASSLNLRASNHRSLASNRKDRFYRSPQVFLGQALVMA